MLSKILTTIATIACIATAAAAEDRHLVILIDRSPVEASYPSSLATSVASSVAGQFEYGDKITILTTGQPDAGSVELNAEFDYRLGLQPDEIAGILDPLIAHAAVNPDPSSDWVRSVEDLSTRVNCSRRDVTIIIVSNLRNPMERDGEGGFLIYPAANGALSGCHILFAGAGHATSAGDRRQIVNLAGQAAEHWGASHALP